MQDGLPDAPRANLIDEPKLREAVESILDGRAPPPQPLEGVTFTVAAMPGPNAGFGARVRYWLYKYVGTLAMVRAAHGDVVVSLERISYIAVLGLAVRMWSGGTDIPATMASFLTVLVGAVFGQGALSTAAFYVRTKAAQK